MQDNEESGQKLTKTVNITQAQKIKIFMKQTRSDPEMKKQLVKEFELLVLKIINISKTTAKAFKGANTIELKHFIGSLI